MRHKFLLILALGFLALAGCEEYEYTIEMRFEDGRVVRKVVVSVNLPIDISPNLEEIYGKQIDKNTYEGTFSEILPQDVGGFGRCAYFHNPMGEVYIYHERFRGKDEQAKDLQHAFASVDKLLDLVIEWLEMELGDHPNFAKLKTFCTTQMRSDLKNICTYAWLDRQMSKPDSHEAIFRIMQYLYEREYFTLDDVSRLLVSQDVDQNILAMFRRVIARKMGYDNEKPIAKELKFLSNEKQIETSIKNFLLTSGTIQKIVKKHCEKENQEAPTDPEKIMEIVMQHYNIEFVTFFVDIFPEIDRVNVTLTIQHEPYETNGQWDEEKKQVTWSRKIRRKPVVDIPFFCYAAFALPNEDYQTKHFGKTILKNEELTLYSFWYKNLTENQQQEWDQCLSTLQGQSVMWETLKAFRFTDLPESKTDLNGNLIYKTVYALELMQAGWKKK